jgi:uncharacterized protein
MSTDLYTFRGSGDHILPRPQISVNGKSVPAAASGGYFRVTRQWQKGDVITLIFPMPIERVLANPGVTEDKNRAAIQRGPLVYCLEAVDNGGKVSEIKLPLDLRLAHEFRSDLLGGVEIIRGNGVTAIPYFAWNNRGKGEMEVWIPY